VSAPYSLLANAGVAPAGGQAIAQVNIGITSFEFFAPPIETRVLNVLSPNPAQIDSGVITFSFDTFSSFDVGSGTLNYELLSYAIEPAVAAIPEPSTYALMLAGLGFVGFVAKRRRKSQTRK
jgi:hypothetical protein